MVNRSQFRTRTRGTRRQIGKRFPIMSKSTSRLKQNLPKIVIPKVFKRYMPKLSPLSNREVQKTIKDFFKAENTPMPKINVRVVPPEGFSIGWKYQEVPRFGTYLDTPSHNSKTYEIFIQLRPKETKETFKMRLLHELGHLLGHYRTRNLEDVLKAESMARKISKPHIVREAGKKYKALAWDARIAYQTHVLGKKLDALYEAKGHGKLFPILHGRDRKREVEILRKIKRINPLPDDEDD